MVRIQPKTDDRGHLFIGSELSSVGPKVILVNPEERCWTDNNRFILHFGAYGWTQLMVWAGHLEDALDTAVDWLEEYAPGILCTEQVHEEFQRLTEAGIGAYEAQNEAEQDTIVAGNSRQYLLSYEWGIVLENPTRQELESYLGVK